MVVSTTNALMKYASAGSVLPIFQFMPGEIFNEKKLNP